MRISYLIIAGLVVCGIIASYFLVPSKDEVAMMKVDGAGLVESQASYETQITVGNLSPEVVFPLVRIYLQNNELERAINLLEVYLQKAPDDIRALERLSTLYQYAGRQEDYASALEKLNQLKSNPENLQKLSDIYNYRQEYQKQAEVLEKLLQNQPDYVDNYIRLAYVYRQMERYDDAIKTIKTLFQRKPDALDQEAVEIWASSLVSLGRHDDAFALVVDWLANKSGPVQRLNAARFANIFYAGNRPDLSLKLLEPYKDVTNEPEIVAALVRAELTTGHEKQAFDRMMSLYQNKSLPDNLRDLFLEVAIKNRNIELINTLVSGVEVQKFQEPRLIQITEFYRTEQNFEAIEKMRTNLTPEKMATLPVLDAIMSLAVAEDGARAKIEALKEKKDLQTYQAMSLSYACAEAEYMDLSKAFLESLKPYTQIKDPDLSSLAGLFLANDMEKEGLAVFEEFRQKRPSLFVDVAWVKLAAANGQQKPVSLWLNARNDDVITPPLLKDIYYIANDRGHSGIALPAAKRLYWRTASDDDQFLYANTLVQNNMPVEAMEHLKELKDNGYNVGDLYVSTLYAAARKDKKYRGELLELLETELNLPETPESRKLAIISLMYQNGIADKYMPMVKEYAMKKNNKQWYYLYTGLLRKSGKLAELRAFDREIAMSPGAPADVKRRYAYDALSGGNRPDAMKLFGELADSAGPKSKDVQQLVYLWGPRPDEENLNWITRRAVNAPAADRDEWLKILYNAGGYQQLVTLVEKIPDSKRTPTMRANYIQSLLVLNQHGKIQAELDKAIAEENSPEKLSELASFGMAQNFRISSETAYRKLEKIEPNNRTMLMNLGFLSFERNEYRQALDYFRRYQAAGGDDYRTYYYGGEILWKTEPAKAREAMSQPYFEKALQEVEKVEQDKTAKLIKAQSLFRLKRYNEAKTIMAGLVQEYPRETTLKADYLLMLVTSRSYQEGRSFIFNDVNRQTQEVVATPQQARAYTSKFTDLAGVHQAQVPNELVLTFAKPIAKNTSVQTLSDTHPTWMRGLAVGYDSVVIVSDAGTQLTSDYGRGKDGNVTISLVPPKKVDALPIANQEASARIEMLHAQIDLETGNQREARMRLEKLNEERPNNPQVLTALSNTEYYMGHEIKALSHIEQAQSLAPQDEEVAALQRRIVEDRRDYVMADADFQLIDDDIQIIGTLSGEKRLSRTDVAGIVLANNYVRGNGVQRADGRFGDFNGFRAAQEAYLRHAFDNGDEAKLSLFTNLDTIGGGLAYTMRYMQGNVTFFGDWHRPNWDFTEGVIDYATRDRVGVTQDFRIRPDIAPVITVAFNRYNVEDHSNVDESLTVTGVARLPLYYLDPSIKRNLFAEYGLDAEYRLNEERGITTTAAGAVSYLYYPLVTREVHYATIGWHEDIDTPYIEASYWEAYGGLAADRFGGSGPYVGGRWVKQLNADSEAQLRASHSISFKETGADSTRLGGYVKYKF